MSAIYAIAPDKLARLIGTPACPVLIDVRIDEDFDADPNFVPGAIRRSHNDVAEWAPSLSGKTVVVICKKGQKLSEGVAAWLRHAGASANVLDGGTEAEVESVGERFGAVPFDIEGVHWSHRGDLCTFDVMVEEFGLQIDALHHLATIVRAADTDRLDLSPEAPGLLAASLGLSRIYADDHEQLDAGMLLYDAFYRWCRDATGETHN